MKNLDKNIDLNFIFHRFPPNMKEEEEKSIMR